MQQIRIKHCSVRKIHRSELKEAIYVFMRSFRRNDDNALFELTLDYWTNWYNNKLAIFYGAFHKRQLVGICLSFPFEKTASLGYMCVDFKYQNLGIGRYLLECIINNLEENGVSSIRLYATKMGENLYDKYGFQHDYIGSVFELNFQEEIRPRGLRVRLTKRILPWIYNLDKEVYGDNRTKLFRFLIKNSQLIVKGRAGFAFVRNDIVGPVVAKNIPVFVDILKYAYVLGARKIFFLMHDPRSMKISSILHLRENTAMRCKRMIRGSKIDENLSLPYAMFNFAIG
ncbi:MAG: GNAT family N-acetyltransferase [Candidatus Lokiarchaeota archaeon]|nr:GNAT family N-acetyltransferase [Candidatus Lokiarchaeota archaeon]